MRTLFIVKCVLATFAKFDDVIRDKCGFLFLVKRVYVRFNYAINGDAFVSILVILHLIKALNSSNILLLH